MQAMSVLMTEEMGESRRGVVQVRIRLAFTANINFRARRFRCHNLNIIPSGKIVVMLPDVQDLHDQANRNLIDFLRIELDLGFTFASVAKTEHDMGNLEHAEQSKQRAITAIESVRYFEERVPNRDAKRSIADRCAELERVIAAIDAGESRSTLPRPE